MPQSNSGSVTQECHLRVIKDGSQFQLQAVSGCVVTQGALSAEMPYDRNQLVFCITDLEAGGNHYAIKAASAFRDTSTLGPWTSPAAGEHWSSVLNRQPTDCLEDPMPIPIEVVFEIYGPVVAGTTPPKVATIKPPTTVKIRSRLGEDPIE